MPTAIGWLLSRGGLKPNTAVLLERRGFDRLHLPFKPGHFRGRRSIAFREEQGWPENDDANTNGDSVIVGLLLLRA